MITLKEFLLAVRQFIYQGKTEEAVAQMRQEIGKFDPSLVNAATMLEARYQRIKEDFLIKNMAKREEYDQTVAQINNAVLEILQNLEGAPNFKPTGAKSNTGKLLHSIPGVMPIHKETRCIIRIAYDEETVRRDLQESADMIVEPVRISKVMDVTLVDYAESPNFLIRPIFDSEQIIEEDEYTQWIFMVKPLREGKFPISMKVAVIEEINGKERHRDIVFEKEVFIISNVDQNTVSTEVDHAGSLWEDTNIRSLNKKAGIKKRGIFSFLFYTSGIILAVPFLIYVFNNSVSGSENAPTKPEIVTEFPTQTNNSAVKTTETQVLKTQKATAPVPTMPIPTARVPTMPIPTTPVLEVPVSESRVPTTPIVNKQVEKTQVHIIDDSINVLSQDKYKYKIKIPSNKPAVILPHRIYELDSLEHFEPDTLFHLNSDSSKTKINDL